MRSKSAVAERREMPDQPAGAWPRRAPAIVPRRSACSWESLLRPASRSPSRSTEAAAVPTPAVGTLSARSAQVGTTAALKPLRADACGGRGGNVRSPDLFASDPCDRPGPRSAHAPGAVGSGLRPGNAIGRASAGRHASAAQLLACRTPAACLQAVHAKHAGHPCASPRTRARAREAWREAGRAHADPHQVAARALSRAGQPPRTSTGHRVWSAVARRKPRAR